MNIASLNSINFNGKLIPKSEYKGVILKLTPAEKKKIEAYEKQITEYTLEDMKLINLLKKHRKNENLHDYYGEQSDIIEFRIQQLRAEIAKIKANRLQKQIEKSKKFDRTV